MSVVNVTKNNYTVEALCQWDVNQELQVYGLSLATIPEIHFANSAMDKAIVRQATMDAAGVISVDIPNSLLQKPYTISVYICTYEGGAFRSLYKIDVPVKERPKPSDYTLVDDPELYSFKALENAVVNATAACRDAERSMQAASDLYNGSINSAVNKIIAETDTYTRNQVLTDDTKQSYGLSGAGVPDDVFNVIFNQLSKRAKIECSSYTGTGTYGAEAPNTITFDFEPAIVMVYLPEMQTATPVIMMRGVTKFKADIPSGSYVQGHLPNTELRLQWDGNVLTWYATEDDTNQLNAKGIVYHYIALG